MVGKKLLLGVALSLTALVSWAGEGAGNWYLGPQIGYYDLDSDRDQGETWTWGLGWGWQYNERWASELSFASGNDDDVELDAYQLNLFRFWGDDWRPFIVGGASHFDLDDARDEKTTQLQLGVGLSKMLSRNWELRAMVQGFHELNDNFNDTVTTLALTYHWAAAEPPPPMAMPEPEPEPMPEPPPPRVISVTVELDVEFDTDRSTIRDAYETQFANIAKAMKDKQTIELVVEGHTDDRGAEAYNQSLSQRRADAVKAKLVQDYAISPERIEAVGYGESRPVADNATVEGRQKNRRVNGVINYTLEVPAQ